METDVIRQHIVAERQQRESFAPHSLPQLIDAGQGRRALEDLLFFTPASAASTHLDIVRSGIDRGFEGQSDNVQRRRLCFLFELYLSLCSALPAWNLTNPARQGGAALTSDQVTSEAAATDVLLAALSRRSVAAANAVLREVRAETTARLAAEGSHDPESKAALLCGSSLREAMHNIAEQIAKSKLRRIAELRIRHEGATEIGNDYAAFLPYALYLGASFATTNPPLVDMAWRAEPARWTPVVRDILMRHPNAGPDELARWVTLEIVLSNMRLLRPLFLLSEGALGCVCLQVNPNRHGDATAMVRDARSYYAALRERLEGGVPNVVFKLPGTHAGLDAARALTADGIGVTITVNFGMFQHIPFAEVLRQGTAIYSCLVEMNGRLAFPVRDELLGKLDDLRRWGIDELRARHAAAWAGVAVVKRLQHLLTCHGYDLTRIKPLVASLRHYEGNGYDALPSPFPDVTETIGTGIISVFPDIRYLYDQHEISVSPTQVAAPVPRDVLDVLSHSEIFRQAYYVADRSWVADEDESFRPNRQLALEDEDAVVEWPPVKATLGQFCEAYDAFVARILEPARYPA